MAPRIDVTKYPDVLKAMFGLEGIAHARDIERKLLHLIRLPRLSILSGAGERTFRPLARIPAVQQPHYKQALRPAAA